MKSLPLRIICACLFFIPIAATSQVDSAVKAKFRLFVMLVKDDDALELSKQFSYPIHRYNPIPDVNSPEEFVTYYPTLFDDSIKTIVLKINDSNIWWDDRLTSNFVSNGIWMDYRDLKFIGVNLTSTKERELRKTIVQEIKRKMYKSVSDWIDNDFGYCNVVLRTKNKTIRVDYLGHKNYRYVYWGNGQSTSEKPDLILHHGKLEFSGSHGGWEYTFTNGNWTYSVEYHELCSDTLDCGYFLRVLYKDVAKSYVKMERTKQ